MGLDMYLTAEVRLGQYEGDKVKEKAEKIRAMFPKMFKTGNLDFVVVKFEAGYWRKANHIHRWFVENTQDGNDNCQESYVERDKLKELLKICEGVLKDKKTAKEELPTQEGFFFGGEEYDKWYFEDIKDTIKIIKRCLRLPLEWSFNYHASW